MTQIISSALGSQTASKTAALEILQKLGKRPNNLTDTQFKKHHDHIEIEHWWVGVRISIKPFWETGKTVIESVFHKGLSTIISWKEFAARLWQRATEKAINLKTQRISETKIKVEGTQARDGWWLVTANPIGLECNCWLYRCEFNRLILKQECEQLLKAIASNQSQIKELYNEETRKLEKSVQIVCHHIKAVMLHEFDCENISDYLQDYHEINKAWRNRNNWSRLSFNVVKPSFSELPPPPIFPEKPTPKPAPKDPYLDEIPPGIDLQRTSDWTCIEYRVYIHAKKQRLEYEGEPAWDIKGIGKIIDSTKGWTACSGNGNISKTFDNQIDSIRYLMRINGYKLEEIAEAYQVKMASIGK